MSSAGEATLCARLFCCAPASQADGAGKSRASRCSSADWIRLTLLIVGLLAIGTGLLGYYVYNLQDIVNLTLWGGGGALVLISFFSWLLVSCRGRHSGQAWRRSSGG